MANRILRSIGSHRGANKHVRIDAKLPNIKMPIRPHILNPEHNFLNGKRLRNRTNVILRVNNLPRGIHSLPILPQLQAITAAPILEYPHLRQHRNKWPQPPPAHGFPE